MVVATASKLASDAPVTGEAQSGAGAGPAPFGKLLATFDGAEVTGRWHWRLTNDPVMGGLSQSTWDIRQDAAVANWSGVVAIVPSLGAPGFCTVATSDGMGLLPKFPDVSEFSHLMLRVRSRTPDYPGFKVSFAANTLNPQFKSFKSSFLLAPSTDWQLVTLPFVPSFSNDWSPFTGDCGGVDPSGRKHVCCTKETSHVCVSKRNLASISQLGIWAEGHTGAFHLEIDRIGAGNLP